MPWICDMFSITPSLVRPDLTSSVYLLGWRRKSKSSLYIAQGNIKLQRSVLLNLGAAFRRLCGVGSFNKFLVLNPLKANTWDPLTPELPGDLIRFTWTTCQFPMANKICDCSS